VSEKVVEILREVQGRQRERELFITPPAPAQEIATLREKIRPELGIDLPEDYAAFLAASNGLDWNGTVFHATERRTEAPGRPFLDGVIEANLDLRHVEELARLLVLGEFEVVDLFVYDPASPSFRILDRFSLHTYEQYDSFELLFAAAIGRRLGPAGDELRARLRHPNPSARLEAASELAKLGELDGRGVLLEGLLDPDILARCKAAFHLGQIGPSWAVAPLAERVQDPDTDVRRDAIFALSATGLPAAAPPLIDALDDEDFERREDARVALILLLGPAIRDLLAEMEEEVPDEAGNARAWWRANAHRFDQTTRYDEGEPVLIGRWIEKLAEASSSVVQSELDQLTTWTGQDFGSADTPGVFDAWRRWWAENGSRFPAGKKFYWGQPVG
jgi:hypothetical protein